MTSHDKYLEWLSKYTHDSSNSNYDNLLPMLWFSFIWNLFESYACDKNANEVSISKAVNELNSKEKLNSDIFVNALGFMRERYGNKVKIGDSFDALFNNQKQTQKLRTLFDSVISGTTSDLKDCVYILLMIAYRLRNNFFHGNKSIWNVLDQHELFDVTNSVLIAFLHEIDSEEFEYLLRPLHS